MNEPAFQKNLLSSIPDIIHPEAIPVAEELRLPSRRRIDLLTVHRETYGRRIVPVFTVVEIKVRLLAEKDLLQIMRYVTEMRTANVSAGWRGMLVGLTRSDDLGERCWDQESRIREETGGVTSVIECCHAYEDGSFDGIPWSGNGAFPNPLALASARNPARPLSVFDRTLRGLVTLQPTTPSTASSGGQGVAR